MREETETGRTGPLPGHGACYICGTDNPEGLGLIWYEEAGVVVSEFTLGRGQQGPPGHVHGGASAAILDEAMGKAVWRAGHQVLAANLNVDYRRPTPLGVALRAEAWVDRAEGRKVYAASVLRLPDGTAAVEATGLYVAVPHFFDAAREGGWG